ncbi:hypothetical protein WJX81_004066 [Elliptochloris bilobata]|uniref:Outer envelope protein 61 n=1 Tax=Elliptochloris bilobata TaxID=381761 RepID=A0AAW1REK8_9CHLO
MMSPEMMKAAMEAASKMTPEQMQQMQAMAQAMPSGQLEQMQRMMAAMPPEMVQQGMQQMNHLSPAEQLDAMRRNPSSMQAAMSQAQAKLGSDPGYQLRSAQLLKDEGNRLFAAKAYGEAADKYTSAKASLTGNAAPKACDLRKACQLNLAACLLALHRPAEAVAECAEVLAAAPRERKALYRRGLGRLALYEPASAVPDLRAALELSPEAEKPVIQAKLREAEAALAEELGEAPASQSAQPEPAAGASAPRPIAPGSAPDAVEIMPAAQAAPASYPASAAVGGFEGFGGGGAGGTTPADQARQMRTTAAMLRANPSMAQQMMASAASMTPEHLETAARMSGQQLPAGMRLTPEMARAAAAGVSAMSPDDLERMADQVEAGTLHPGMMGGMGGMGGGGAPPGGMEEAMRMMQANPDLMKTAMDMMGSMPAEQIAAMQRSMMGGGAFPGVSPPAAPPNPAMMEMMKSMMKNISPEQMAAMSRMAGRDLSPAEAQALSERMRGMSDAQMRGVLMASSYAARGWAALQAARRWLAANPMVFAALMVLLLAVLARRFGLL